ncbi:MAG: hypothetical protein WAK20_01690 [Candidatus Acidiferrum sp.]
MKNLRYFLLAFTAMFMASTAHAQQTNVNAAVPFDFVIGSRVYAAGQYSIKAIGMDEKVLLIDNSSHASAVVLSNTCEQLQPSAKTELVFHRVGDSYFLYQIWREGNSEGREFPISRSELLMTRNHPESPETIIVAANITH